MSKITVLFIIDILYGNGGTETSLFRLLTHLDREKFEPIVVPLEPTQSPMIGKMMANGIRVKPFPVSRIYGFNAVRQALRLKKFIQDNHVDIVQTIHFNSDIFGGVVARWAGVPVVISSRRDLGFTEHKKRHIVCRRVVNRCFDIIVANSNAVLQEVRIREQTPGNKLTVVYNGVDVDNYTVPVCRKEKLNSLGLRSDVWLIGMVANVRPIKGFEYFIQAAARVKQSFPGSQFVVVGGDAEFGVEINVYKKKLVRLTRKLGLEDEIVYLGMRHDVAEILAVFDIYVSSSLSEGFSNTILEAMASGKPVVATNVGGNSEAVIHGETGFLVPPADADAIAEAIVKVLSNQELCYEMGCRGRSLIQDKFSILSMSQQMQRLFTSLYYVRNSNHKNDAPKITKEFYT